MFRGNRQGRRMGQGRCQNGNRQRMRLRDGSCQNEKFEGRGFGRGQGRGMGIGNRQIGQNK